MEGSKQAGTKDGVLQEMCVLTWPLSELSQQYHDTPGDDVIPVLAMLM